MQAFVSSEIGRLETVIIHTPGPEIENMTPSNAERALYSDILNLSVAKREYNQFVGVLQKVCEILQVKDLLIDVLNIPKVRENLIFEICRNEGRLDVRDDLLNMDSTTLATSLIEGVLMKKDNLSRYLNKDLYAFQPLHNFFYTRDSAVVINNQVLIGSMKSKVREREALIMETIFDHNPLVRSETSNPSKCDECESPVTIEGGDILVLREDILCVGIGSRTSSQGVDFLIGQMLIDQGEHHIIVQELPGKPESFIHLDMTFTMLDHGTFMVFEPLILKPSKYQTVHININHGKVQSISNEKGIAGVLNKLGMEFNPILCGGTDPWDQEREQWHSGANFFAFAPGKVLGYERNVYTLDQMAKAGYEIVKAADFISGKIDIDDSTRCVVTIEGSELSRGGGGCRCMTMPFRRR